MSHVFVSYARPDEPLAEQIANALREQGFEVWRDDDLPAHRPYAEVIEERIRGAAAVVVLWSCEAVKSQWVRAEADTARGALTLVQATIDGTMPPMPFNQIHCADLQEWHPETDAHGDSSRCRRPSGSRRERGRRFSTGHRTCRRARPRARRCST